MRNFLIHIPTARKKKLVLDIKTNEKIKVSLPRQESNLESSGFRSGYNRSQTP